MEYKQFGKFDESISRLGFGCWGIGKTLWVGAVDVESRRALQRAIEAGVNFFDTALVYGDGHSEQLVGEAERISGKKIFIATKIPSNKYEWPAADNSTLKDSFSMTHIISRTEQSLRNLNRDYIDLQQFHVWNDKWADEDDWKEAVYRLKKDGKVRFFGISINDHQPWNGIETAKTGLIDSFQVIFNIFDQSPIDQLFPFCKENKIAIIARVPLDEGGLTGNITPETEFPKSDWRNHYFKGERKKEVFERATAVWAEVQSESASLADAALRFIISFDEVTTLIPGMRSEKNLRSNVQSVTSGPLSAELIKKLERHRWVRNFY